MGSKNCDGKLTGTDACSGRVTVSRERKAEVQHSLPGFDSRRVHQVYGVCGGESNMN